MKYYFVLILAIVFIACSANEEKRTSKKVNYNIKRLKVERKIDNITLPNGKIYYFNTDMILKTDDKENIIYFSGKDMKLIFMDTNFVFLKHYDLSNFSFWFNGIVEDFDYYDNKIYFNDGFYYIKQYDLETNEMIKMPDLFLRNSELKTRKEKASSYNGGIIRGIKAYNENIFVTGVGNTLEKLNMEKNIFQRATGKYIIGTIINYKENKIIELLIDQKELKKEEINTFLLDQSYINIEKDTILICKKYSKKVFKFNLLGQLLGIYEMQYDKKTHIEPKLYKNNRGIKGAQFNKHPLQIDKNAYYKIIFNNTMDSVRMHKFDKELEIVTEYRIKDTSKVSMKTLLMIKNNIYGYYEFFSPLICKIDLRKEYE